MIKKSLECQSNGCAFLWPNCLCVKTMIPTLMRLNSGEVISSKNVVLVKDLIAYYDSNVTVPKKDRVRRRAVKTVKKVSKKANASGRFTGGEPCHYCEQKITGRFTVDHMYPISKLKRYYEGNGTLPEWVDVHNNLVPACVPCNQNKANKNYHSFKSLGVKKIRHLKKQFNQRRNKNQKP